MERLWAPWRLAYVQEAGAGDGCVFCAEAAGELGDASLVVHRGERAFVLLNKFPYSSGHLMVAPIRHTHGYSIWISGRLGFQPLERQVAALTRQRHGVVQEPRGVGKWRSEHRVAKPSAR